MLVICRVLWFKGFKLKKREVDSILSSTKIDLGQELLSAAS